MWPITTFMILLFINFVQLRKKYDVDFTVEDREFLDVLMGKCSSDEIYDEIMGCIKKEEIEPPPNDIESDETILNHPKNVRKDISHQDIQTFNTNNERNDTLLNYDDIFRTPGDSESSPSKNNLTEDPQLLAMYEDVFGTACPNVSTEIRNSLLMSYSVFVMLRLL